MRAYPKRRLLLVNFTMFSTLLHCYVKITYRELFAGSFKSVTEILDTHCR